MVKYYKCSSCNHGIRMHYFENKDGKFCPTCFKKKYPKETILKHNIVI